MKHNVYFTFNALKFTETVMIISSNACMWLKSHESTLFANKY